MVKWFQDDRYLKVREINRVIRLLQKKIYSVLGRDPNVPTGGVRDFTVSRVAENQLQSLYKFLQQHGVETKNITLSDLENLYDRRFNTIKSTSNNNYNLAVPQGTEALPRQ